MFFIQCSLLAEGTRELAPNANITVAGNATTDIAALHIGAPAYNNFASFSNTNPNSRLYIHVKDPSKEGILLGFSFGHLNVTSPNPTRTPFIYRIKDPNGNIVYGPIAVPTTGANIQNWSEGFTGPEQLYGAGGYDADEVTSADLTSQGFTDAGNYYIEFSGGGEQGFLIDFWDITVVDISTSTAVEKKGRVWSYNWSIFAINDFGFPERPFNGAFYVCAPDPADPGSAFITKIDFNGAGFQPAAFNVAFNRYGISNTGDVNEDRRSVENVNATEPEYEIFLNDPIELCRTAQVGEITLIGIGRCSGEDYCIKFTASKEGQIDLLLDFDGDDNLFTPGTADIIIAHAVDSSQVGIPSCIYWDGLDGLGNPLVESATTQIPIVIAYAQGIYHFPIYDAERMVTGFMLEAVRPAASIPLLHYDDSKISVTSLSGEPAVQISGCNVPCHRWTRFVDNTIPGFGNLHTINSWWFSQRIVRQDIFFVPSYYACEIDGPEKICSGSTTEIFVNPSVEPAGATGGEIVSMSWTGPGIVGSNEGISIEINESGDYAIEMKWINGVGDTCLTSCTYHLEVEPPLESFIDTLILQGETVEINGEIYNEGGIYIQNLEATNGCDSILTITIKMINSVIYYDLEACYSHTDDGTNMDYSEFGAAYPQPLSCADLSASILHRDPPQMNKHSCTQGVNGTIAMCISAQDTCGYDAGNQASLAFEVTITPDADTAVQITGFTFYDKAPTEYNWIDGPSGPNDYPTLFGFRVLKNGVEIYREEAITTFQDWTFRSFDFSELDDFVTAGPAVFRFEILPYCLVGTGASVAAWDIDDVYVQAACVSPSELNKNISGLVYTPHMKPLKDVRMTVSYESEGTVEAIDITNGLGEYTFRDLPSATPVFIRGYKDTDPALGVTTLDLIRLQKHLLGREEFTSPYQFIAADVNQSWNLTAVDLIEIRKLVLGIYSEFPHVPSYRIGYATEDPDEFGPWLFKEELGFETLSDDLENVNLFAVKSGDVTGQFAPLDNDFIGERSAPMVNLHTDNILLTANQSAEIHYYAKDLVDLAGLQLELNLNDGFIEGIQSGTITITADQYHFMSDHSMRLSWYDISTVTVSDEQPIFTITITPARDMYVSELINISNTFSSEAYIGDVGAVAPIELDYIRPEGAALTDILYQNQPNPFSDETVIPFELVQDGTATIRIFETSGRLLKEVSGEYTAGRNSVAIDNLPTGISSGVFICQLQTKRGFTSIRMVKL